MFGYQNVGFALDRDVIKVGGELGKFDRIRLRVLGNDIHIVSLKVVYVDGDCEDVAVDAEIKANKKTQWFDLKGDRFIREIQMVYRSQPNLKGQARVEVTGQYAQGWLGTGGEGRKYNEGWVLLGAQTAGFTGFDHDTISVGENEGGFTRLRVAAKDRAITLEGDPRQIRLRPRRGVHDARARRPRNALRSARVQGRQGADQGDRGEIPLALRPDEGPEERHRRQARRGRDLGPALNVTSHASLHRQGRSGPVFFWARSDSKCEHGLPAARKCGPRRRK